MNEWQQRFAQKVEAIRETSRERFERFAENELTPLFDEFREFMTQQGFHATVPVVKPGIRIFKFAVSENAYLLTTWRLAGLEHGEAQCEFFVPGRDKLPASDLRVELCDANADWARGVLEKALDQFMEAFLEWLSSRTDVKAELIGT